MDRSGLTRDIPTHDCIIATLQVGVSRVLLGRHHVADVVCGMVMAWAMFETVFVAHLWLPDASAVELQHELKNLLGQLVPL